MGDGSRPNVSVSSSRDLHKLGEEEEEELRMLASLCREQTEEDEQEDGRGHRLSASQQRRCNVSLSISSDDTTTWTQCYPVVSSHVTQGLEATMEAPVQSTRDAMNQLFSPSLFASWHESLQCQFFCMTLLFIKGLESFYVCEGNKISLTYRKRKAQRPDIVILPSRFTLY